MPTLVRVFASLRKITKLTSCHICNLSRPKVSLIGPRLYEEGFAFPHANPPLNHPLHRSRSTPDAIIYPSVKMSNRAGNDPMMHGSMQRNANPTSYHDHLIILFSFFLMHHAVSFFFFFFISFYGFRSYLSCKRMADFVP